MSEPADKPPPTMTQRHYQAVCAIALSALILIQMQQTTLLPGIALFVNVLIGVVGVLAIFYRARLSPLVVLIAISLPHIVEQYHLNQMRVGGDPRDMRFLNVGEVLWCTAALAYFVGHYRLHGLWFGILPADARIPAPPGEAPTPPRVRSEDSLRPAELAALVFAIPATVLAAEVAVAFLKQHWAFVDLDDPRWKQLFVVAWGLLIGMFLFAHAFRHWRRLQMDRASALLTLQDTLWTETRGEQRTINRWIVWKKLSAK